MKDYNLTLRNLRASHTLRGKKKGKKNCPTENNSGALRVPPKIIKMLEFRNFGIPFRIGITVSTKRTENPKI